MPGPACCVTPRLGSLPLSRALRVAAVGCPGRPRLSKGSHSAPLSSQLRKEYGTNVVPAFPPKKIFTLTPAEVEQRREQLEKYMQAGKRGAAARGRFPCLLPRWHCPGCLPAATRAQRWPLPPAVLSLQHSVSVFPAAF